MQPAAASSHEQALAQPHSCPGYDSKRKPELNANGEREPGLQPSSRPPGDARQDTSAAMVSTLQADLLRTQNEVLRLRYGVWLGGQLSLRRASLLGCHVEA